jgi:low affinity Fe/Cu permease
MDSGTISQLVFFIFGAVVCFYGFILYRSLSQLRDGNERVKARLDSLARELREEEASLSGNSDESRQKIAELQERIRTEMQVFNNSVRLYNARIGQFPEAIVAAIMGLKRQDLS